jgi:hypothetical protein
VTPPQVFRAPLQRDHDGTWWFVHVPKEVRQAFKHLERRGTTPVHVTVGGTSWAASLMPWADGSAQIVVNAAVRRREGLHLGQQVEVMVSARA